VQSSATPDQIRQAYKKESLKTHPDRLPPTASVRERKASTERFQAVADAYYVLSDPIRRREYDDLLRSRSSTGGGGRSTAGNASGGYGASSSTAGTDGGFPGGFGDEFEEFDSASQEQASGNFFKNFGDFFKNASAGGGQSSSEPPSDAGMGQRPDPNNVFGDVFEEMLAPEVAHVRPFWSYAAGAAGGVIGYVVGNVPGMLAGAVAGNRLGAIRDAKGKSVGAVFASLGSSQKAEILRALAFKVLGSI